MVHSNHLTNHGFSFTIWTRRVNQLFPGRVDTSSPTSNLCRICSLLATVVTHQIMNLTCGPRFRCYSSAALSLPFFSRKWFRWLIRSIWVRKFSSDTCKRFVCRFILPDFSLFLWNFNEFRLTIIYASIERQQVSNDQSKTFTSITISSEFSMRNKFWVSWTHCSTKK